jgi:hypothetical protein
MYRGQGILLSGFSYEVILLGHTHLLGVGEGGRGLILFNIIARKMFTSAQSLKINILDSLWNSDADNG